MGQGPVETRTSGHGAGAPEITITGQRVILLPHRAAFWVERKTLLVADLHLGKSETMGAAGIPIPAGMLERELSRLSDAINATGAVRVVIVGDLLHAPAGQTELLVGTVSAWRRAHSCEVIVVPGNHDRRLSDLAEAWQLTVTDWEWTDGPFAFRHEPAESPSRAEYCWCGHLHPAVHLRAGGDRLKLPCFHVGARHAVLPAFSPFTAGGALPRMSGDRLFAIADDRVIEV